MTELDEGGTFGRSDVQAWIDGLDEKEAAMLAQVVGEAEYRAAIDTLHSAAEWVAELSREHAKSGRRKAAKASREVVGVLLRAQRAAENVGSEFAGQPAPGALQ